MPAPAADRASADCFWTPQQPMPLQRRNMTRVELAVDHAVGKLILEAPYTSIADIAAVAYPILPVRWLLRDQFHSDERIAGVTAPLLIMHGAKDSTISIGFGERLFALAHEPKKFVRFPEGGHNDLDNYGATETAR